MDQLRPTGLVNWDSRYKPKRRKKSSKVTARFQIKFRKQVALVSGTDDYSFSVVFSKRQASNKRDTSIVIKNKTISELESNFIKLHRLTLKIESASTSPASLKKTTIKRTLTMVHEFPHEWTLPPVPLQTIQGFEEGSAIIAAILVLFLEVSSDFQAWTAFGAW